MLSRRELGVLGGACGLVVGAAMVTSSITGLVHERDRLKAELGATAERPTPTETVTASPTASPAAAPSSPPQASPAPLAAPVVQAAAPNPGSQPSAPASTPPRPPASPSPSAPPRCAAAETVMLRLPVRELSCNAVIVGGSG